MSSSFSSLIPVISQVGGTMLANNAQGNATDAQIALQQQGLGVEETMFNTERQDLQPYRAAGTGALQSLEALLGIKPGPSGPSSVAFPTPTAPDTSHMGIFDSFKNLADPANLVHKGGGSFLGNFFDPGNVVGANPKAGNPNPYTKAGGEAVLAYFGGGALGAKGGATNHRALGGPVGGQSYMVGEDGPEMLHMAPGAEGFVTPNPGTMMKMMMGGGMMAPQMYHPTPPGYGTGPNPNPPIHIPPFPGQPPQPPGTQPRALGGPVGGSTTPGYSTGTVNPGHHNTGTGGGSSFNPFGSNTTPLSGSGQTPSQILQSQPQYQFAMQQGIQGLDNSAIASGGLLTGGHMKAIMNYSQGLASNTFQSIVNNLANVASLGSSASSMGAQTGMYTGMSMANLFGQMGQTQGAGIAQQGNNMSQMMNNLAMMYGQYKGGGG